MNIKDKKITIMTNVEFENELGEIDHTLGPLPGGENIWAYYRHASGNEIYKEIIIDSKVEVIFEINWRSDLTTAMQIKYKNELYNITRIDDFEGYKTGLKLFAYNLS